MLTLWAESWYRSSPPFPSPARYTSTTKGEGSTRPHLVTRNLLAHYRDSEIHNEIGGRMDFPTLSCRTSPTRSRSASRPSNGRKADAEREPSLLLPDRSLPGLAPVLVDVIFEAISGAANRTTPSSSGNSMPSPPSRSPTEFGKLNMLGDAPKLLDESFVTAANLKAIW